MTLPARGPIPADRLRAAGPYEVATDILGFLCSRHMCLFRKGVGSLPCLFLICVTTFVSFSGIPPRGRRSRLSARTRNGSRKEVFQPHLPVRLPCYDLAPVTDFTLGRSSRRRTSSALGFHGLTGGVYKARERIHRAMADARLLANPASWSRVADSNPN